MIHHSGRDEAVRKARGLLQQHPIYLDTETTGTGPEAEIIEIALLDHNGDLLFESLVRPKSAIEPDAGRLHGITEEMVQGAPHWRDLWPQVELLLAERVIGIYNSEFDLRLLRQTHQKNWMVWRADEGNFFCIMKLYALFFGDWDSRRGGYRWHSLEQAGQQCGIKLPNIHRARDDALLARALLIYMAEFQIKG